MNYILQYFNPRLRTIFLLGFASGLPLALSGSTLQAWYTDSGVGITTIGFLSLVGIPYVFKFLWAPVLDKFIPIKSLGIRRGWIFIAQLFIVLVLLVMAIQSPRDTPLLLGVLALSLAFFSASQDIAFDAYRTDLMKPQERGLGAAFSVTGYRIAMLVSGGIVWIIADYISWQISFISMAILMLFSMLISFRAPQPLYLNQKSLTLRQAVTEPFKEFVKRNKQNGILILVFIVVYKLGDAFAGNLSTAFLLRGINFSLTDIGLVTKTIGLGSTLLGVFLGGVFLYKKGLYRSLLWFGILQAITNLGFVFLSLVGKNYLVMVSIIALENLAGGMGTAAFVAFLMGLCDHRYSATQFALFSALAAVGRVYVGPLAGYGVEWYGWTNFFGITVLMAIPGLLILLFLRHDLEIMDTQVPNNE